MIELIQGLLREDSGQNFAEYALILGAISVGAIAVIARYHNELQAAFDAGIEAPRLARGGGMFRPKDKGQAMSGFALMIPDLILLLFGMTFATFYAFRSAAVGQGVFIEGVAGGLYSAPATGLASASVQWPDLSSRINTRPGGSRQVCWQISVKDSRDWVFGIHLLEAQRAAIFFHPLQGLRPFQYADLKTPEFVHCSMVLKLGA